MPPRIVKQTPPPRATATPNSKQSIRPPSTPTQTSQYEDNGDGIKLLEYGRSKTGKTRLAATFPKPLLIIGTEKGWMSIATEAKPKFKLKSGASVGSLLLRGKETGMDFCRLGQSSDIDELVEIAAEKYKSVNLDTAGGLQDMILKEILGLKDVPVQKSWGMATQQQYGTCTAQFKERARQLLDLVDKNGLNVVIIAHERNFKEEGGDSELVSPSVGAALTPSATGWLNGAVDYIGQTFLRSQTITEHKTVAGKSVDVDVRTGKVEYCLRVAPHEVFMTGFRLPPGMNEDELPDAIVNPTYDLIMKLIKGN